MGTPWPATSPPPIYSWTSVQPACKNKEGIDVTHDKRISTEEKKIKIALGDIWISIFPIHTVCRLNFSSANSHFDSQIKLSFNL